MRTAIVTRSVKHRQATILAEVLLQDGVDLDCVVVESPGTVERYLAGVRRLGLRGVLGYILSKFGLKPGKSGSRRRKLQHEALEKYARSKGIETSLGDLETISERWDRDLIRVDDMNSADCVADIERREIDLLLNAGGGIYREALIEAPRVGILNAHMGKLPEYRGMNTLEWSLFYGDRPYVTLHFIDRGIDTGDVVKLTEIPIEDADSIDRLRSKASVIGTDMLVEAAARSTPRDIEREPQEKEGGRQYFVMHDSLVGLVSESQI